MNVYKEKQFLIFDFENGKNVKYDFATKTPIGKKGMPVCNLKSQLRGLTMKDIFECCEDQKYAAFLNFVMHQGGTNGYDISNIGTILENVPRFSKHEQLFSAGLTRVDGGLSYGIGEIPKGILKECRERSILLTNDVVLAYKMNPDAYTTMFNMDYESLDQEDMVKILTYMYQRSYYIERGERKPYFLRLIDEYGYQAKPLLQYIDTLKTYEAIDNVSEILKELDDYARMMSAISRKFDRYPRHFLTTHKIATRNYNRLKTMFDESEYRKRIKKDMEKTIGQFVFIYPDSTQDIKDEAVQQNNCVASYIKRVIDGGCDIMFMRNKDSQDKSLVTLEIVNGEIVQAKQHFNYEITQEQREAIAKWNGWYAKKKEEEKKVA